MPKSMISAKDDDLAPSGAVEEMVSLETRITATPCFTTEGLAAKREVIERADFGSDTIIDAILAADAERVG